MEYVQSAMLLHHAGKEINEENVTKVLEAAGVEVEEARVKSLVAALEGTDIDEAIEEAQMPSGGGAAPAPPQTPKEGEEEETEERSEEEEGKEEAEAAEGLGSLFENEG